MDNDKLKEEKMIEDIKKIVNDCMFKVVKITNIENSDLFKKVLKKYDLTIKFIKKKKQYIEYEYKAKNRDGTEYLKKGKNYKFEKEIEIIQWINEEKPRNEFINFIIMNDNKEWEVHCEEVEICRQ